MRRWPRAFLEAMQPAELEVSMAAIDQIAEQARRVDRQWEMIVERVRYEAELARRRFLAVEPENRLVGRTLERDWEAKLAEVERLERESTARPAAVDPPGGSRGARPDLGVGAGPARAVARRHDNECRAQAIARIPDQRRLPQPGRDDDRGIDPLADGSLYRPEHPSSPALLRCAPDRPRRAGSPPCLGGRYHRPPDRRDPRPGGVPIRDRTPASRQNRVKQLRYIYSIPSGCPEGPPRVPGVFGRMGAVRRRPPRICSMVTCPRSLIGASRVVLDGIQSVPHGPWWIKLTPEIIARLRKPTRRSWTRRSAS